jgi:hypothetical protein
VGRRRDLLRRRPPPVPPGGDTSLGHATLDHGGVTYDAIPARIVRTDLGYEDHGIFTISIMFQWGSAVQGMPGWSFGKGDDRDLAGAFIRRVLAVTGRTRWKDVTGTTVYVLRADGAVRGLASLEDDAATVFVGQELFAAESTP